MREIDKLDLDKICIVDGNVYHQPDVFAIIDKINEIIEALNETN